MSKRLLSIHKGNEGPVKTDAAAVLPSSSLPVPGESRFTTLSRFWTIWRAISWMGSHKQFMSLGIVLAEYATKTALSYMPQDQRTKYEKMLLLLGLDVKTVGLGAVGQTAMNVVVSSLGGGNTNTTTTPTSTHFASNAIGTTNAQFGSTTPTTTTPLANGSTWVMNQKAPCISRIDEDEHCHHNDHHYHLSHPHHHATSSSPDNVHDALVELMEEICIVGSLPFQIDKSLHQHFWVLVYQQGHSKSVAARQAYGDTRWVWTKGGLCWLEINTHQPFSWLEIANAYQNWRSFCAHATHLIQASGAEALWKVRSNSLYTEET